MPAIIEPTPPSAPDEPQPSFAAKLAWFVGLSLAGAGLTAAIAYGLRMMLLSA